jgi:prepilin-type N-terminal cleavage/methylation domain-containing protein
MGIKTPERQAGFTLLELLIYTAILGIVGAIGASILFQITRTYTQNRSRTEVVQNLRSASQMIQQAIQQARGINTASGTTLSLLMPVSSEDPTEFRLNANAIERKVGAGSWERITSQGVRVTDLDFSIVSTILAPVDPIHRWAWNGNGLGWIDFNPPDGNVRIPQTTGDFLGFARVYNLSGDNGLIALNCASADNCTNAYHVSVDDTGKIAGWAWNSLFGWISFCGNASGGSTWDGSKWVCPASPTYGVNVDPVSGDLAGWAWMANFGWISFCGNASGGSTWDGSKWVCPASPTYKVAIQKRVGRPLNAIQVRMSMEYNTLNPLLAYNETYNFAVALSQPAALTVSGISPSTRSACGTSCSPTITGANFKTGANVRLSRPGYTDIVSTGTWTAAGGGTSLSGGTFDIAGAASGTWDVWVQNPDGQVGVLPDGFTMD